MSEVAHVDADQRGGRPQGANRRSRAVRVAVTSLVVALLLILPLYVDEFWLRTGFAVCAAVIGAIGLNLLVGTTGLLSLGHAFFLAVGAITYCLRRRRGGRNRHQDQRSRDGHRWSQ